MKNPLLEIVNQKSEPYPNLTVSKIDSVHSHYTKVPNHLLRKANFSDPTQLAIYLFLFSFSHGYSKNHCEMSQEQIMEYTGASRNTVKRSLNALIARGLIKITRDYTCKRIARRYEILIPSSDDGEKLIQGAKSTRVKLDPVKNGQCSNLTDTVSKIDSDTGSKFDTTKESIKNKLKNSLSGELKIYFESLPKKKFDREQKSLEELLGMFSLADVAKAFNYLKRYGEPRSGNPVHSPIAFLAFAMSEVLGKISEMQKKHLVADTVRKSVRLCETEETSLAALEQNRMEAAENAFRTAFPNELEQKAFLEDYLAKNRFAKLIPVSAARNQAIAEWHSSERSA